MNVIVRRREAIASGVKSYFTGKPCPNGHIAHRFTASSGCVICVKSAKKKWADRNPEKTKAYTKKYLPRVNKVTKRKCNKEWDKKNPDKKRASCKKWSVKNMDKVRAMRKRYYDKKSAAAKFACSIRNRIRDALKNGWKSQKTIVLIGCSFEKLKIHLERQFTREMSWSNYGSYWHVDHIRPCSAYNLNLENEQMACFNFRNLRPLEAIENITKGDKITLLC